MISFVRFATLRRMLQCQGTILTHVNKSLVKSDTFVTDLKDCDHGDLADSLVRDWIICSLIDHKLCKKLLQIEDMTLEKAISTCQLSEISRAQADTLHAAVSPGTADVHSVGCYARRPRRQKFEYKQRH